MLSCWVFLEAAEIDFTAVENHANIVGKEPFNSLLRSRTPALAPPTLALPGVYRDSSIQYIRMLIFHITFLLLQTIFYNRENKLLVITLHARTN